LSSTSIPKMWVWIDQLVEHWILYREAVGSSPGAVR